MLRKDFIIDPYQVLEARAHGADAVLLIVACLSDAELRGLMELSRAMGMEPLVEVHSGGEMERAVAAGAGVIGINNRDLRSFHVDLGTTDRLAGMAPAGTMLVGLQRHILACRCPAIVEAGASAVLVGEALMAAEAAAMGVGQRVLGQEPRVATGEQAIG